MDTNTRLAHSIGRLTRTYGDLSAGRARKMLAARDRSHFVDAAVLAVTLGLIAVEGNRLTPGPNAPLATSGGSSTARSLSAALNGLTSAVR